MVIQCAECQTRFKLADDKMQPEGIKVRCAKCKHVFKVFPPAPMTEPPPPEPLQDVAAETSFSGLLDEDSAQEFSLGRQAESPSALTEEGSEEAFAWGEEPAKPAWEDFALDEPSTPQVAPASGEAAPSEDFELEAGPAQQPLETTDFGGDRELTADLASSAAEVDFGFEEGPIPTAGDFDFGLTESSESSQEAEPAEDFALDSQPAVPGKEDFTFGGKDDARFDDLLGDDGSGDFSKPGSASNLVEEFSFAEPGAESAGDKAFDFGGEADTLDFADLGSTSQKDMSWDDLESDAFGEEFDLDADEQEGKAFEFTDLGFQEEARGDTLGDEDFGSIPLQSPSALETPPQPVAAAPSASPAESAERPNRPAPPAPTVAAPRQGPLRRLVLFVLGLLLALSGAAGYFAWQNGGLSPLVERLTGTPPAPVIQPQVRLSGLNGYFVTNKDAGQLFVIQGQATNEYPEIRSAITVKGALYDKGGKLLVQQTVFCGNRLDDSALQELPFAKISEAMNNQFGDTLSNLNVAPGKSIPFTIVFRNFPPELAEFTVETVDSRPGSN
jgi:predicted Zn finger-like uncharacterized protein